MALGMIVSVGLAGAGQAGAQTGAPPMPRKLAEPLPDDVRQADVPAAGPSPAAEPAELPPLADDSAVTVTSPSTGSTDPAGEKEPWSRGVDVARRRAARQVFLDANDRARNRFFATAAAKYKQAIQLWPHPAFAYNLALAQLQLDQPVEAHANLKRAIAHGPAALAGKHEHAQQQLALIETELAPVEVICSEPGAHVMLDGRQLFTGPGRHRGVVRPGAHQLVATRPGLIPVVEQMVVSPGEPARFALAFEHREAEGSARLRWTSISVVGAGVALALAGGALDWHSTRLFDDYERDFVRRCPMGCMDGVPPELEDRRARAGTEQRAAVIAYGLGGAALATGVVLIYRDRGRTSRRHARSAPDMASSTAPATLAPMVSPGVIGMNAGFRF
jgi:hypothetical protein